MSLTLKALLEMFKGTTQPDPSLHTAFLMWVDTSGPTPVLKRRNATNTAWYVVNDTGGSGGSGYEHIQVSPSATWTITHSLGYRPNIQVIDDNLTLGPEEVVEPLSIVHDSTSQATVTLSTSISGRAICK